MSATYLLYLEAKIDGKWKCIDGYYYIKSPLDNKEELTLATMYDNGSRSYFSDTYDKLLEISNSVPFTELSQDIQTEHPSLINLYKDFGANEDNHISSYPVIYLTDFKKTVPSGFQYHGVYHKDNIAAYENGEIEELWEEEKISLKKLTKEERKCYEYKEWDSPFGWQYHFKKLDKIISFELRKYYNNSFIFPIDDADVRIVAFCL